MTRIAFALLLLPSVALAQQVDPVTAGAQAMALDGGQMFARMAGQIAQDQRQHSSDETTIAELRKQVAQDQRQHSSDDAMITGLRKQVADLQRQVNLLQSMPVSMPTQAKAPAKPETSSESAKSRHLQPSGE
jgi:hypothetical protein